MLFDVRTPDKLWRDVERISGVDNQQARRTMMDKASFMRLMDIRMPTECSQECPYRLVHPVGKNDDDD